MADNASQTATLRQQLSSIVGSVPFGIVTISDEFEVDIINGEAVKLLGFADKKASDFIDCDYHQVLANIPALLDKVEKLLMTRRVRKVDLTNIQSNEFSLNIKCRSMLHGTLIVIEDLTDEHVLQHKVTHDNLTQLVNRQHFEERLATALTKATKHNLPGAILFIDLDRFKPVNDTAGHAAGDELLKRISTILQSRTRARDTVARIGGDEFAVLLEDCPVHVAESTANHIRKDVEKMRFSYESKVFNISLSTGIAPICDQYINVTTLMHAADTACRISKEGGRNRVHIINARDGEFEEHVREVAWLDEIKVALKDNRFLLYAQKVESLKPTELKDHYEILIRLKGKDGSIIPPGAFLSSAERYDLMPSVDRWVIEETFRSIKPNQSLSINLSGQSFSDEHLADFILERLAAYKVSPLQITFEITETAAIHKLDQTSQFIHQLKIQGFQFSLDDFGTGLSSYSYLQNMAVDYLKIDGVFIKEIATSDVSYAVVKSINDIGHAMGLMTVAEFVEDEAILDKLREIGVDYAQGYHIHKPEPLQNIPIPGSATPLKKAAP